VIKEIDKALPINGEKKTYQEYKIAIVKELKDHDFEDTVDTINSCNRWDLNGVD